MSSAPLQVIHCDNHLLVVAKPACVPMVPDDSGDPSLLDLAREWVRVEFQKPGNVFLGVVQRLDRPVSGVVCFARTSKAANRLTNALRERRVKKSYWGVAAREPQDCEGELEQWLAKDTRRNRVILREPDAEGARRALTRWRIVARAGAGVLLDLEPVTGRTHQLRFAAKTLGSPLLGDVKYGAAEPLADRSIALHARSLTLDHPTRDIRLLFELPSPDLPCWSFGACDELRERGTRVQEL